MNKSDASAIRSEAEIRAEMARLEARYTERPKLSKTGVVVIGVRIQALRWVLGEDND